MTSPHFSVSVSAFAPGIPHVWPVTPTGRGCLVCMFTRLLLVAGCLESRRAYEPHEVPAILWDSRSPLETALVPPCPSLVTVPPPAPKASSCLSIEGTRARLRPPSSKV